MIQQMLAIWSLIPLPFLNLVWTSGIIAGGLQPLRGVAVKNLEPPTGSSKKQESSRKTSTSAFIDYTKAFDCVDHNKLQKILQEIGISDLLTCFQRNLYTGQEATVRTGHGTRDWSQIGKGVYQSCVLSLCLFNLYAENIMWNAGLDEAQPGIKIAGKNINKITSDMQMILHLWQKVKRN